MQLGVKIKVIDYIIGRLNASIFCRILPFCTLHQGPCQEKVSIQPLIPYTPKPIVPDTSQNSTYACPHMQHLATKHVVHKNYTQI